MYTSFYGLREKPFALSPDPRFLYLAASHREALAHLLYGIEQGEGFISVTGEVGTGKTTLCRTLLERLEGELEVAFLFNPSRTALELLQTICAEFGLPAEGLARRSLMAQLNDFLLEKKSEGRRVLLIIDEAQTLSENTLEQVRLLSNLETSREKLIQILLLGQPELDRKLDAQGLRQLRQRISVRWMLNPLEAEETRSYVRHRIAVAAGEPKELFTEAALRDIHRRTGGIPRLVNQLCDRALLGGYAARAASIGPRLVRDAAREIPDARRARVRPQRTRVDRPWFFFAVMLALVVAGLFAGLTFGRARLEPSEGRQTGQPAVAAPPPGQVAGPTSAALVADGLLSPEEAAAFDPANTRVAALAPGLLARMLASRDPSGVVAESEIAVLREFGTPLATDDRRSAAKTPAELEARLGGRGLATTAFSGGSLGLIEKLEHPVIVALHPDGGSRSASAATGDRWAAVLGVEGDRVRLAGIYRGRDVTVPRADLERHWTKSGLIVWRKFETLPDSLSMSDRGAPVLWLQQSLAALDYLQAAPSGYFDENTRSALASFQRAHGLGADGIAGPLTQIALFGRLPQYPVPRLSRPADSPAAPISAGQEAGNPKQRESQRG